MKLPAYPKYKTSGVEWLGDVPEKWEVKRLKYVAGLSDVKIEADPEMPVPYIGLEHVESWTGKLLPLDLELVPSGIANQFKKGSVLFGKLRPYLAKACTPDFTGLCSTELLVLEAAKQDNRFLRYSLLTPGFISLVDSASYGVKMPRASWDFVGVCNLPLPPLPEQQIIADFLDKETARLDALVAKNAKLIERLKEKRTALLSHTVTRGLNSKAKLKSSGNDWLGDIPAHWEVLTVRHRAKLIKTGGTPPTAEERYYEDGTVPWFGPGSFDDQIVVSQPVKLLNSSAVKEGAARMFAAGATMVVAIGATLGKVSSLTEPGSCNQQITVIEFDERRVHPRFATYQLKRLEPALRAIAPSATLPILDQGEIADIAIGLPPIPEQTAIAEFLDAETARIDDLVAKVETAVERLQEYRTALITSAVTGKIDVRKEVA